MVSIVPLSCRGGNLGLRHARQVLPSETQPSLYTTVSSSLSLKALWTALRPWCFPVEAASCPWALLLIWWMLLDPARQHQQQVTDKACPIALICSQCGSHQKDGKQPLLTGWLGPGRTLALSTQS